MKNLSFAYFFSFADELVCCESGSVITMLVASEKRGGNGSTRAESACVLRVFEPILFL